MDEMIFDVFDGSEAEQLRDKLRGSDDYKKLSAYQPLRRVFQEVFDRSVLEDDDVDTLISKMEALPYIMPAAEKLLKAIHTGNAWEFGPEDRPDFASAKSIIDFTDKLYYSEDPKGATYNATNIIEKDILKIFDEGTVRDARGLFYNADIKDISKPAGEIIQELSNNGVYFCVDPSGIEEAREEIENEIEDLKIQNFDAKRGAAWLRLAKLGIAGLAVSAVFFGTRTGMISDTYDLAVLGASAGAAILYFLAG